VSAATHDGIAQLVTALQRALAETPAPVEVAPESPPPSRGTR
jgi:hypothetical protein